MSKNVIMANMYLLEGDFEKVIEILKYENLNRPKVLQMLGESYFALGFMDQAYEIYERLFTNEEVYIHEMGSAENLKKTADYDIYSMLEEIGVNIFSESLPDIDLSAKQNLEYANESYPETDEFIKFYNQCVLDGNNKIQLFIERVKKISSDSNKIEAAKGDFYAGEYGFFMKNYPLAYNYYLKSIHKNPNKALVYGYAGNCLLKENERLINGCILNTRAIKLDSRNARWHLYQGLLVLNLGFQLDYKPLIAGAKLHFENALKVIRPEQESLKGAIIDIYDKIKDKRILL